MVAQAPRTDALKSATKSRALVLWADEPVGWAPLTHRSQLPHLATHSRTFEFSDDDPLSLAYFYIHRTARAPMS